MTDTDPWVKAPTGRTHLEQARYYLRDANEHRRAGKLHLGTRELILAVDELIRHCEAQERQ